MKFDKLLLISFVAPFMVFMSTLGLIFGQNNKKIFYIPIGLIGIFIILEKDVSRKLKRRNIIDKIRNYQKVK